MNKIKVHFVGIGGSGMSGAAMIAHLQGYEVSGCDLNTDTPYIDKLKKAGIKIYSGHDAIHTRNVDLIVVTPAVFFQNEDNPEIKIAKKENKLMTWQEFLGKYLQKNKKVICIAGTHGKSTTTAMVSLVFQYAGLDPTVMIGANVKEWNANYRIGKSDFFVTEADEFFDNFLHYKPQVIILNNIEFDHPDYFKDENQVLQSFKKFINNLTKDMVLIYNDEDEGIKKLFKLIGKEKLNNLKLIGYTTKGIKIDLKKDKTYFFISQDKFVLKVPGIYNVSNSLGVIKLAEFFNIDIKLVKKTLGNFEGIGRRMELIGEGAGIKVYDDYAHHPTAIKKTLEALRQKYPKQNIFAIIEPHTYSRTKALLPLYKNAFESASFVIIAPIFRSRDKENFGVSENDIVKISGHKEIKYIDSFKEVNTLVIEKAKKGDVIVVMGAGESYKLAREILKSL